MFYFYFFVGPAMKLRLHYPPDLVMTAGAQEELSGVRRQAGEG